MLEKLNDLPLGIEGLRATGEVTESDYEQIVVPLLEEARRGGRRIRFLYQFGPEFKGFSVGGAWQDTKVGLRFMRLFAGCAIVTDLDWLKEGTHLMGFFMPCPVRVFGNQDLAAAASWLAALPEEAGVSHRLLPESGIIVVEVHHALRAQDFDALAATADAWIEAHDGLQGLVVHLREFPGWENVAGLLRHMRFVRDHHRKISRVAFSADSKLTTLTAPLADHFVAAQVKSFGYDDLDAAVNWAKGHSAGSQSERSNPTASE